MPRYIGNPLTLGACLGNGAVIHMSAAERARHLYVVGATRTGKSKLLEDCIRQDILAWPRSGCGLMAVDRHGSLFDNTMKWAAAGDLSNWPIVPIDLRRSDWIVAYNPLRRRGRGEDDSVVVGNFVRSILHNWGQTNLNETPRLLKWLEAMLYVLLTNRFTLAEALELIVSPAVRRSLVASVEDSIARSVWDTAPPRESDFLEMVESTVNRVRRFLSRRVMRATLGQSDVSLDLGDALEQGQIILACLATEGGKIDDEDASTIGSLLLSDLWMAAKTRGKRDEGKVKPFYVYLDEFQEYLTPSIADTLDQSSGFGLHMTFAHQFPSQLLRSETDRRVYDSVMSNCRSKIVFQLEHNRDLEELALTLYRHEVDTMKVKQEIYVTRTLGHQIQYMQSVTEGTSSEVGGGRQVSRTTGTSHSVETNWSHTDTESESFTETDGTSEGESIGYAESIGTTEGRSIGESRYEGIGETINESDSSQWSETDAHSTGNSTSNGTTRSKSTGRTTGQSDGTSSHHGQTVTLGRPREAIQGELEEFENSDLPDGDDEEFQRDWGRSLSVTRGKSEQQGTSSGTSETDSSGDSHTDSQSTETSLARSRGGGRSRGLARSNERGRGSTLGTNCSVNAGTEISVGVQSGVMHSESTTRGTSSADSYGGAESWGTSEAKTIGKNTNWSDGTNRSITMSPMLVPIIGKELSSITFATIEEQLFAFAQYIAAQPDRHCVVRIVGQSPVPAVTLMVEPGRTTDEWVAAWSNCIVQALPFALPMDRALQVIADRRRQLHHKLLHPQVEPMTNGIPIGKHFNGPSPGVGA